MNSFVEEGDEVRRHIIIRNVYEMMAYAFRTVDTLEHRMLESEDFDNFEDLMAAILALGMSTQLRRGLEHEYLPIEDDLTNIRGHVDVKATQILRIQQRPQVHCIFDEFTIDTMKNRVIVTAGMLLLRNPRVSKTRSRALKRSLLLMRDVPTINEKSIDWGRLQTPHSNGYYNLLLGVCRMILESKIQTERQGQHHLTDIELDQRLSKLYERFILEYFRYHHPELSANADVISSGLSGEISDMLPQLQTDITLHASRSSQSKCRLIIDTKCYRNILINGFGKPILRPDHLNQIFKYVLRASYGATDQVAGMLLYAHTKADPPINEHWIENGHDFYVQSIDLGRPFQEIRSQLDGIGESIFSR